MTPLHYLTAAHTCVHAITVKDQGEKKCFVLIKDPSGTRQIVLSLQLFNPRCSFPELFAASFLSGFLPIIAGLFLLAYF